jgi:predicted Ser/Thr protein kinase
VTCPNCRTPIAGTARFCPSCGHPLSVSEAATRISGGDDGTRLAGTSDDSTRLAPGMKPSGSPASGWLSSSSGSVDHGRFAPGTVLDGRYRVLGLLGRGGMGEVYRADDLRLGQQVALKFMPAGIARDAVRLAQFHNEVRTARQVSHANVCRMYDIGEIDGQLFLTMEYVDGEDLSSLLRRIGRLPEDKAIEIARQICAGLAAAHERGVLHRDLKPANIMLDGAGRVRIMDFSLAAAGEVTDIRAGTPAYMAPEQLEGREVTARSDVYALGLVLYELFTGKRAFDAKTLADLVAQHQSGSITVPTEIVKGLDPAIERAIMRCLEPDPARRPASPLAIAVALPGGDPLAAAIAAGETPSPEMIAAAGTQSASLSPVAGALWFGAAIVLLFIAAWAIGPSQMLARVPLSKPAAVLADRAEQIRQSFGYTEPVVDTASVFNYDQAFLRWASRHGSAEAHWAELSSGRPPAVRFAYRTSPMPLVPRNYVGSVTTSDPPVQVNGMTYLTLDTMGRLIRFEAAPAQVEPGGAPPSAVDWDKVFEAAALPRAAFTETQPGRTPPTFADERRAWQGTLPGTKIDVHLEAAAYRGRPVFFDTVAPWTIASRELSGQDDGGNGNAILVLVLLVGAAFAARANLRSGRADRRGAYRLAVFTFFVIASQWVVADHVLTLPDERLRLFLRIGLGMFVGGAMYLVYLGLEPFVRRSWPKMLVSWSRLLTGRIRDPLVGRDLVIGAACGAGLVVLHVASILLPMRFGLPEPIPQQLDVNLLTGPREFISVILGALNSGLENPLIDVFALAVGRALFEWVARIGGAAVARVSGRPAERVTMSRQTSERVFVVIACIVMALTAIDNRGANQQFFDALYTSIENTITLFVFIQVGLFGAMVMVFVQYLLNSVPLTLATSRLYSPDSWTAIVLVVAVAAVGLWMARGGGALAGDRSRRGFAAGQ